jgi:hypothetical protein
MLRVCGVVKVEAGVKLIAVASAQGVRPVVAKLMLRLLDYF